MSERASKLSSIFRGVDVSTALIVGGFVAGLGSLWLISSVRRKRRITPPSSLDEAWRRDFDNLGRDLDAAAVQVLKSSALERDKSASKALRAAEARLKGSYGKRKQ